MNQKRDEFLERGGQSITASLHLGRQNEGSLYLFSNGAVLNGQYITHSEAGRCAWYNYFFLLLFG